MAPCVYANAPESELAMATWPNGWWEHNCGRPDTGTKIDGSRRRFAAL